MLPDIRVDGADMYFKFVVADLKTMLMKLLEQLIHTKRAWTSDMPVVGREEYTNVQEVANCMERGWRFRSSPAIPKCRGTKENLDSVPKGIKRRGIRKIRKLI